METIITNYIFDKDQQKPLSKLLMVAIRSLDKHWLDDETTYYILNEEEVLFMNHKFIPGIYNIRMDDFLLVKQGEQNGAQTINH